MLTEEQKEKRRANLAKAREARKSRSEKRADSVSQTLETAYEAALEEEIFPVQGPAPDGEFEELKIVVPAEEPETPFTRFLETLDAETRGLLDDAELRAIFDDQQMKARAERRAEVKKLAQAQALEAARIAEGVIAPKDAAALEWGKRMKEKIRFTVDLPEMSDIGLRMDQHIYLHGHTYTVSRAQFESMRSMVYQAQQGELAFEGKDRGHWLRRRARGSVNGYIELGA